MKKRRKHRLFIDVTMSKNMSSREAAKALSLKLSDMPLNDNPVYATDNSAYVDKVVIIEPSMSRKNQNPYEGAGDPMADQTT